MKKEESIKVSKVSTLIENLIEDVLEEAEVEGDGTGWEYAYLDDKKKQEIKEGWVKAFEEVIKNG